MLTSASRPSRSPRATAAAVALLLAVLLSAIAAGRAAAAPLPVVYNFPAAFAQGLATPTAPPPGANDFACKPTAAHPRPVVLVHGTFENMYSSWAALSPLLRNEGYCVFALNYGGTPGAPIQGTGPIAASAVQLAAFVDEVLAATGAAKVDIVGHSQGGMMPRQYLERLGGAARTDKLIALTPSNQGTTFNGLLTLAVTFDLSRAFLQGACAACVDQAVGSPFLRQLNAGGDTVGGVSFTVLATTGDEVITPYTNAFLTGPGATNIVIQKGCPIDNAEHEASQYSRRTLGYVRNALDPAHPRAVPCTLSLPLVGG